MELLRIPEPTQPQPPAKLPYRIGKRWKKVNKLSHANNLKVTNDTIMLQYYGALKFLKAECLQQGTLYFERDYKDDNSDPFTVHSFVCENLFFNLECDFNYFMQIEYDFAGFPRIEELLWHVGFAKVQGMLIYKPRIPNLATFFNGVVAYQGPQYIHTL